MRVEDAAVPNIRPLVVASVIVGDPFVQCRQHRVLFFERREFLRLPGSACVVREAGIQSRIQEDQLRAARRQGRDEISVAALDDPPVMLRQESLERITDRLARTQRRDLLGLPNDGVEIEMGDPLPFRQRASVGALARARVTKHKHSHRPTHHPTTSDVRTYSSRRARRSFTYNATPTTTETIAISAGNSSKSSMT